MSDLQGPIDGIDVELLEPLLRSFVAEIGLPDTLKLVEKFGGVPFYFPRDPRPEHPLAQLVGFESARKLGRLTGGESRVIPKAGAALRELRDRRLRAARGSSSVRQLAMAAGLTRRRMQQILAEDCGQPDDDQPGLFG